MAREIVWIGLRPGGVVEVQTGQAVELDEDPDTVEHVGHQHVLLDAGEYPAIHTAADKLRNLVAKALDVESR